MSERTSACRELLGVMVTGAVLDVHEARREGTSLFHQDACSGMRDIYMQVHAAVHVEVLENPLRVMQI